MWPLMFIGIDMAVALVGIGVGMWLCAGVGVSELEMGAVGHLGICGWEL
jgi:hypothetical protein